MRENARKNQRHLKNQVDFKKGLKLKILQFYRDLFFFVNFYVFLLYNKCWPIDSLQENQIKFDF